MGRGALRPFRNRRSAAILHKVDRAGAPTGRSPVTDGGDRTVTAFAMANHVFPGRTAGRNRDRRFRRLRLPAPTRNASAELLIACERRPGGPIPRLAGVLDRYSARDPVPVTRRHNPLRGWLTRRPSPSRSHCGRSLCNRLRPLHRPGRHRHIIREREPGDDDCPVRSGVEPFHDVSS